MKSSADCTLAAVSSESSAHLSVTSGGSASSLTSSQTITSTTTVNAEAKLAFTAFASAMFDSSDHCSAAGS